MHVISPFDQISLADAPAVGGKGANLGEMTNAGFPVPAGFVVRAEAYLDAIDAAGVRAELESLRSDLDATDDAALAAVSEKSRAIVRGLTLPEPTAAAIREAYERLGDDVSVAVRSSGTAEDSGETSFAGMNETFTNVSGVDAVLEADRRLLGVAVRRAEHCLPCRGRARRGADDRGRRADDDPVRALRHRVHRRSVDERSRAS